MLKQTHQLSWRLQARSYASKPQKEKINLRGFITVGIFASIILTQVVDAVNQEKPLPRSMSETEYYRQQQRLKRKTSLFTPEEKEVYFLKGIPSVPQLDGVVVIDPSQLLEQERNDESSKYHALLNDPDYKQIPRGLVVDLIGKKLGSQPDGKFVILDFPGDTKESTQFEEKVVQIKGLVYPKNSAADDVVKYYKTVDKVKELGSPDELISLVQ